jgi:hypothetical protein
MVRQQTKPEVVAGEPIVTDEVRKVSTLSDPANAFASTWKAQS